MRKQIATVNETRTVGASLAPSGDGAKWLVNYEIEKYHAGADDVRAGVYGATAGERAGEVVEPYDVLVSEGNKVVNIGADLLWAGLTGGLSASTGLVNTYFNNANAGIRVGIVATTAKSTDQNILATTATNNSATVGMEATYPIHETATGGGSTTNRDIAFRSVFSTDVANFAWAEWGVVNTTQSTAFGAEGLLNRKAEALGTKTAAATWTFTVTLSLST